jgi:hypothetical protein
MPNVTFAIQPSADGNQYSDYPDGDKPLELAAPSSVVLSDATETSLTYRILKVAGATGYELESWSGSNWPVVETDFTDDTTHVLMTYSGLTAGQEYGARFRATNGTIKSPRSSEVWEFTDSAGSAPDAGSISIAALSTTSVRVSNSVSATDADTVEYEWSASGGFTTPTSLGSSVPVDITGLSPAQTVYARRKAVNAFGTSYSAVVSVATNSSGATLVYSEQFESPSLPSAGWYWYGLSGGTVSINTSSANNYNNSAGSVKGTYPGTGDGNFVIGGYNVYALQTRDIYIEFRAKIPGAKRGAKFLKVFSRNPRDYDGSAPNNYCNTTFAAERSNAAIQQVSFGDGTGTQNDTANVINLNGTSKSLAGRSYPSTAIITTPQNAIFPSSGWGTDWHHFRMRCKFNDGTTAGNEVANGAYYLEIDGVVYVDASGLFNRHYSNDFIERIELFGYADSSVVFEMWYDDLRISTGGFL